MGLLWLGYKMHGCMRKYASVLDNTKGGYRCRATVNYNDHIIYPYAHTCIRLLEIDACILKLITENLNFRFLTRRKRQPKEN